MVQHQYHLKCLSANKKLGGIPASTTSQDSCPDNCSFKGNGCYGESGPISIHFRAVSGRKRGTDLDTFCESIRKLPKRSIWRHNQVGDLPGSKGQIHRPSLDKIVKANRGRHGFTFTHYPPNIKANAEAILQANSEGFTVNLSAETLAQADEFVALKCGPVVVTLPANQTTNLKTPAGSTVVVCPASIGDTTCALCALCAVSDRKSIVGFPSHGLGAKRVEKIFWAKAQ